VPRPRLIERLNAGLHRKLTLVSAPAGFGKTTLLSEWIGNWESGIGNLGNQAASQPLHPNPQSLISNLKFAWLSLDEGDNDPTRFLAYFVAALQTIEARQESAGNIGKGALSALESPQPPPTEAILTALLNEIAALPDRIVLVLDDYHLIEAQPIHDALTFLLRHLPPQIHLVIATREDPILPLARLRARGQLTELRATDLRFSSSEAAAFLNQVMGLDLSAEDIAALERRTEGWIAGLQLAAISMQGRKDVTGFIQSFTGSHHFVLDYLVEEVLEQQSESVQTFLLQTAVLDRLTGSLCDALTGQDNGRATLEMLEHANLFIVPLDDERRWYRYHHLFADLLRQRLRQRQSEQLPILHSRASEWYDQNAFPVKAVHHALAVPDFNLAAEIIERAIPRATTWTSIDVATLQEWFSILPDDVMRPRPRLRLVASRVFYLIGRRQDTERILQQVEAMLEDDPTIPDAENILGLVLADRASYAAVRGDVRQAIAFAQRALTHLPENEATTRMRVSAILGLAHYRAGDTLQAGQAFLQSIAAAKTVGLEFAAVHLVCNLAQVRIVQGRLDRAIEICQQALDMAVVDGVRTSMAGLVELELTPRVAGPGAVGKERDDG
jgi:LuxR family maltose regulon positive regulatory protein